METFEVPILELGVSLLYLNQRKLESVRAKTQEGLPLSRCMISATASPSSPMGTTGPLWPGSRGARP